MKTTLKLATYAAVTTFCCTAGAQLFSSEKEKQISVRALINIEALTNEEDHAGQPCYNGDFDSKYPEVLKCGKPCKYEPVKLGWFPSSSTCV